jgi:salicylate hydroxylase
MAPDILSPVDHTTGALVVGGGMAGLAAALVLRRHLPDLALDLLEQAEAFSEVGAGIQLGPNAVRVLRDWGLEPALQAVASYPSVLKALDARTGREKGYLRLGDTAEARYGAPYATVHRADLHGLLHAAVRSAGVDCHLRQTVEAVRTHEGAVHLQANGAHWTAEALLGCDGLWSRVRECLWPGPPAAFSGHLAFRGLVRMAALPHDLRRPQVVAWLGERMHAVHYPVRSGEWLNVVVVVQGDAPTEPAGWDHAARAGALKPWLAHAARDLQRVTEAVPEWRLWPLYGRAPVRGPHEMVRGAVALMGDAAHPMRPYLAQGAAMALEDAWALGECLGQAPGLPHGWSALWQRWVQLRWRRCAWVQARSLRNGTVFHASGPLKWARNGAMAVFGERLMDVPRLYSGPPPCA